MNNGKVIPPDLLGKAMQTEFQLTIKYNAMTGRVLVDGPIHNQMLCYGMIEMARNAVNDYSKNKVDEMAKP